MVECEEEAGVLVVWLGVLFCSPLEVAASHPETLTGSRVPLLLLSCCNLQSCS